MSNCHFYNARYKACNLLKGKCTGTCSFYKSHREFIAAQNIAIAINRRRGNCAKCKYKTIPCEFEVIPSDG